eukprot:GCRY01003001.1.p1 GENE.GCRY01003001.1~~GCRY01003001.1.p1  ORF type:complete len:594 (+),score=33.36 GCRY01003001.1:185-1966(+)
MEDALAFLKQQLGFSVTSSSSLRHGAFLSSLLDGQLLLHLIRSVQPTEAPLLPIYDGPPSISFPINYRSQFVAFTKFGLPDDQMYLPCDLRVGRLDGVIFCINWLKSKYSPGSDNTTQLKMSSKGEQNPLITFEKVTLPVTETKPKLKLPEKPAFLRSMSAPPADSLFHRKISVQMTPAMKAVKRHEVIKEIIVTEKTYTTDLEHFITCYLQPIKRANILSAADYAALSSVSETLLLIHNSLLKDFLEYQAGFESAPSLGQAFLTIAPYLKIYSEYCSNQRRGLDVYYTWEKNDVFNQILLNAQESVPGRLRFPDLQIKPVQRLLKYPLLLGELLSLTDQNDSDYHSLQKALNLLTSLAETVNERKRVTEGMQKVIEINALIEGKPQWLEIVTPTARLVRQGLVTKVSRGRSQDRYFFLFNHLLIYAKQNSRKKNFQFKGCLSLAAPVEFLIRDLQDPSSGHGFEIIRMDSKLKAIQLMFKTEKEMQVWRADIELQMNTNEEFSSRMERVTEMGISGLTEDSTLPNALSILKEMEGKLESYLLNVEEDESDEESEKKNNSKLEVLKEITFTESDVRSLINCVVKARSLIETAI